MPISQWGEIAALLRDKTSEKTPARFTFINQHNDKEIRIFTDPDQAMEFFEKLVHADIVPEIEWTPDAD